MGNLTFKEVDHAKYPAVDLAYSAGRSGGTMTGVLSAANEKVHTALPECLLPRPLCSAGVRRTTSPWRVAVAGNWG